MSKKEKIIIYGKGDFAKLMKYNFERYSECEIVAFCVDNDFKDSDQFCNLPLISIDELPNKYNQSEYKIFVAVGYSNMRNRKIMYEKIKTLGYTCVNYISPKAIIDPTVKIGENNVILDGVIIEPFVEIGDNNIIWSGCIICHNVTILSHCFIAAQSLIGGFSVIKNNCFIGFNSTIVQNIIVEDETLVGAKSLVLNNTEKYSKYYGIPARKISQHEYEGIKIIKKD